MLWLSRQTFDCEFERRYLSNDIHLNFAVAFSATASFLRKAIPHPPDDKWRESDPGPILRWYGECSGILIAIEHPTAGQGDETTVMMPHYAKIGMASPIALLSQLRDCGPLNLGPVHWIMSDLIEAETAVLYRDIHGIRWEVYRAPSFPEATAMLRFLDSLTQEIEYFLGAAEDTQGIWVSVRIEDGTPERVVARYGSRATAEAIARENSLLDSALFAVRREDHAGAGLAFRHGRVISGGA